MHNRSTVYYYRLKYKFKKIKTAFFYLPSALFIFLISLVLGIFAPYGTTFKLAQSSSSIVREEIEKAIEDPSYINNLEYEKIIASLDKVEFLGETRVKVKLEEFLIFYLMLSNASEQIQISDQVAARSGNAIPTIYSPVFGVDFSLNRGPITSAGNSSLSNHALTTKVGLKQKTPLGMSYFINYEIKVMEATQVNYNAANGSYAAGDINSSYLNSFNIGVNLPLLRGIGDGGSKEIKKAVASTYQARLQSLKNLEMLAQQVINRYTDANTLIKQIKVLQVKRDTTKQLLDSIKVKYNLGMVEETNLLELEAMLIQDDLNLQKSINALNLIDKYTASALNIEKLPYGLYPADENELIPINETQEKIIEEVKEHSNDLKILGIEKEKANFDRKGALSDALPKLDLTLSYSIYGYSNRSPGEAKLRGFDRLNGHLVALNFELPLTLKNIDNYRAKRLQQELIDKRLASDASDLALETENNLEILADLETDIAKNSILSETRQKIYHQTLVGFENGTVSSTDLGQSQTANLLALQSLDAARAEYLKLYYKIQISRGKLFNGLFPLLERAYKSFQGGQ